MSLNSTEKQVLELISFSNGLSRKKISQLLHLSQANITKITKNLIEHQFIIEGERFSEGMGRKEVLLISNPRRYGYLGIDIGGTRIRFAVSDNNLNIIAQTESLISDFDLEADKPAAIIRQADNFLLNSNIPLHQINAVGIGITGIVDVAQKCILNIPNLTNWDDIDLVTPLTAHFSAPVFLEEGGRTMALAEKMLGKAAGFSDFIVVHVGYGIVAGIMMHDQILRGINNTAGLLGHVTADPKGMRCLCGNYGCLENIITYPMLEEAYQNKKGKNTSITKAYQLNDKLAIEVCIEAGQALGIALSNVVNLLNPQAIYVGGAMFDNLPLLFNETKRTVTLRGNRFSTMNLLLESSSFHQNQGIIGALSMAKTNLILNI